MHSRADRFYNFLEGVSGLSGEEKVCVFYDFEWFLR